MQAKGQYDYGKTRVAPDRGYVQPVVERHCHGGSDMYDRIGTILSRVQGRVSFMARGASSEAPIPKCQVTGPEAMATGCGRHEL